MNLSWVSSGDFTYKLRFMASLEKSETLASLDPGSIGNDLQVTGGQSHLRNVPSSPASAWPIFCFPSRLCARSSFQSDLL